MKQRLNSQISDSEEEEEQPKFSQTSLSKSVRFDKEDSSDFSSDAGSVKPTPRQSQALKKQSPKKKVASNPLHKFIAQNESFTKIDIDAVVSEEEEEDVCLLEVPKCVEASSFLNKLVNFDKRTKVKLNKIKYVIEPELEDIKPLNLLSRTLKVLHPISVLKVREYKKHKHSSEIIENDTKAPSVPENLKVRHPLFGSEYINKIIVSKETQEKLDGAIEKALRKKKKKHKDVDKSDDFMLPEKSKKKKKKKSAMKTENESSEIEQKNDERDVVDESIFALLETHISKKGKSKKSHKNSEIQASTSFLSSNSFTGNGSSSSDSVTEYNMKKRTNDEINIKERESSIDSGIDESKNKKKKKRDEDSDKFVDEPIRKNSIKLEHVGTKKRNSFINSTVLPDLQLPVFEFDVSLITNQEETRMDRSSQNEEKNMSVKEELPHKKKKKKEKSVQDEEDVVEKPGKRKIKVEYQTADESSSEFDGHSKKRKKKHDIEPEAELPSPKKKKKVKEESEEKNSLIFNLLNKIKSEIDTPRKK